LLGLSLKVLNKIDNQKFLCLPSSRG